MYHTLEDLKLVVSEETLIQLSDDSDSHELDDAAIAVINKAGASAANIIHGYLTDRYTIPLPQPVPGVISEISVSLTLWGLYRRRMTAEMPESIVKERANALSFLEHVQQNKISLYPDRKEVVTMTVNKTKGDRMFGWGDLGRM